MNFGTQLPAEMPRARQPLKQAENMAGDVMHHAALGQVCSDVGTQRFQHLDATAYWRLVSIETLVHLCQQIGIVVCLTADHHAIEPRPEEHTSEIQSRENLVC